MNFSEFYHKGSEAVSKLLKEKQGQVKGAFFREDLGDIDLVCGEVSKNQKGEIQGYGLAKILQKHSEDFSEFGKGEQCLINGIDEIVKNGKLIDDRGIKTIILKKDSGIYRVWLTKGWYNKGDNQWIITAYKVDKSPRADSLPSNEIAKGDVANLRPNDLDEIFNTNLNKNQEPLKPFEKDFKELLNEHFKDEANKEIKSEKIFNDLKTEFNKGIEIFKNNVKTYKNEKGKIKRELDDNFLQNYYNNIALNLKEERTKL